MRVLEGIKQGLEEAIGYVRGEVEAKETKVTPTRFRLFECRRVYRIRNGGCEFNHQFVVSTEGSVFFEDTQEEERDLLFTRIGETSLMDMESLIDAYRCVYFDTDVCNNNYFLDGLTADIVYFLNDDNSVSAVVNVGFLIDHLSRSNLDTDTRRDRIECLSRFVEMQASDTCDFMKNVIMDRMKRQEEMA